MSVTLSRKIVNIISILGIVATIIATIYFIRLGVFKDINALRGLVGQSVILGPIIFMLIQIIQVVIPIIPGGVSCAAGVLIFGPTMGFVYNYVGIALGSIIIFLLGRNYGKPFIMSLVSDKTYNKYIGWLDKGNRFDRFFIFMMIWPVSPADFLCMLAALTKMSFKRYMTIIILTKPFTLVVYTYGLTYIIDFFWQMVG